MSDDSEVSEMESVAADLIDVGQFSSAEEILSSIISSEPSNARAFAQRGLSRFRLRKFSLARDDFDRAINLVPTAVNTLFMRARTHEELGYPSRALSDYQIIVAVRSDIDDAFSQIGRILEFKSDFVGALEAYSRALSINPKNEDAIYGVEKITGGIAET